MVSAVYSKCRFFYLLQTWVSVPGDPKANPFFLSTFRCGCRIAEVVAGVLGVSLTPEP